MSLKYMTAFFTKKVFASVLYTPLPLFQLPPILLIFGKVSNLLDLSTPPSPSPLPPPIIRYSRVSSEK